MLSGARTGVVQDTWYASAFSNKDLVRKSPDAAENPQIFITKYTIVFLLMPEEKQNRQACKVATEVYFLSIGASNCIVMLVWSLLMFFLFGY